MLFIYLFEREKIVGDIRPQAQKGKKKIFCLFLKDLITSLYNLEENLPGETLVIC